MEISKQRMEITKDFNSVAMLWCHSGAQEWRLVSIEWRSIELEAVQGCARLCMAVQEWRLLRLIGIITGNPWVFSSHLHPHPSKPIPMALGRGFHRFGYGFSWFSWVTKPMWVCQKRAEMGQKHIELSTKSYPTWTQAHLPLCLHITQVKWQLPLHPSPSHSQVNSISPNTLMHVSIAWKAGCECAREGACLD